MFIIVGELRGVPFSHQNERRKYVLFCKHILCVVVCKQPEAKTYSLYFCLQKRIFALPKIDRWYKIFA